MNVQLTPTEARVVGCLMEKSVITPDQYPLTLNALTSACNQKSSRDPVMSLEPGVVQRTARGLEEKHLVSIKQTYKSRVEKYTQRLCNTPFAEFQLDEAQFAVLCLLLLRGPQTPGELKSRSGRLHTFESNQDVTSTLTQLMDRDGGALVTRLPRSPGRQDSEYAHLLCGPVAAAPTEARGARNNRGERPAAHPSEAQAHAAPNLEARVAELEREVAELRRIVRNLDKG